MEAKLRRRIGNTDTELSVEFLLVQLESILRIN